MNGGARLQASIRSILRAQHGGEQRTRRTRRLPGPFTHFLRHRGSRRLSLSPPLALRDIDEDSGKGLYERRCALDAGRLADLSFTAADQEPAVSIVIVACDNYEKTAHCIVSAADSTRASLEVIVFDNGSSDAVRDIPRINPGIRYMRAPENLGFTIAVNRAARMARGRILLLLNNDIELTAGAIDSALATLEADRSIGAVGARVIRMHGRLQEAGSLVWSDGSTSGYARDCDPLDGQANFIRDVDFCSACFLALRRSYWEQLGGFDEVYAPAYSKIPICACASGRRQASGL